MQRRRTNVIAVVVDVDAVLCATQLPVSLTLHRHRARVRVCVLGRAGVVERLVPSWRRGDDIVGPTRDLGTTTHMSVSTMVKVRKRKRNNWHQRLHGKLSRTSSLVSARQHWNHGTLRWMGWVVFCGNCRVEMEGYIRRPTYVCVVEVGDV